MQVVRIKLKSKKVKEKKFFNFLLPLVVVVGGKEVKLRFTSSGVWDIWIKIIYMSFFFFCERASKKLLL